jgi:hypothetical protein
VFCGLVGVGLIAVGGLGFAGNADFAGADHRGAFLGLDVNGWHNLIHIATGLLLLAGASSARHARAVCVLFAGLYALIAILGWVDGSDVFGFVPIDRADNVLHSALAVIALIAAAAPAPRDAGRADDDESSVLQRSRAAYDASSPKQVFVGVRD